MTEETLRTIQLTGTVLFPIIGTVGLLWDMEISPKKFTDGARFWIDEARHKLRNRSCMCGFHRYQRSLKRGGKENHVIPVGHS